MGIIMCVDYTILIWACVFLIGYFGMLIGFIAGGSIVETKDIEMIVKAGIPLVIFMLLIIYVNFAMLGLHC